MPSAEQTVATLTEFLSARIAEDEAAAQEGSRGRWKLGGLDPEELGDAWSLRSADREHLWRWYPDRVLAECDAKRRIVEEFRYYLEEEMGTSGYVLALRSLPLLALPYADHPDYREEWRPDANR